MANTAYTAGGGASALPTQTGNSGGFLTTDGTNPSWAPVSSIVWQTTSGNQTLSTNNGYVITGGGNTVLTFPATATAGDQITVVNQVTANLTLQMPVGSRILSALASGTPGGTASSNSVNDAITLVCIVDNSDWQVESVVGTFEIDTP